jgi:6,7-dimethyl-8-ribityllumazine synthase
MDSVPQLRGQPDGAGRRFGIVAATFNEGFTDRLVDGAVQCLLAHGADAGAIRVVRVPGAWEIGTALEELARTGGYDALIAIGVVVRGDTPHFDYICTECSRAVADVARSHRLPVTFGVLTCDDEAQAEARCGGRAGNKGTEAALAALEMVAVVETIRGEGA